MVKYYLLILIAISFIIPQAFGDAGDILYTESEPPTLVISPNAYDVGGTFVFEVSHIVEPIEIDVKIYGIFGIGLSPVITLEAGVEYTVTQMEHIDFTLSSSYCIINDEMADTTFTPVDGDTILCKFSNTYTPDETSDPSLRETEHPILVIIKNITARDGVSFGYAVTSTEPILRIDITTVGESTSSGEYTLTSGVEYTVIEERSPPSYDLVYQDCTMNGESVGGTKFTPKDDYSIVCTFDSVFVGSPPSDDPPPSDEPADTTRPVIQITGDIFIEIFKDDPYVDAGATCTDDVDIGFLDVTTYGDIVDTAIVKTYYMTYDCIDAAGNAAIPQTRTIVVSILPASELRDSATLTIRIDAIVSEDIFYFDIITEDTTLTLELIVTGGLAEISTVLTAGIEYTVIPVDIPAGFDIGYSFCEIDSEDIDLPFIPEKDDVILCYYLFVYTEPDESPQVYLEFNPSEPILGEPVIITCRSEGATNPSMYMTITKSIFTLMIETDEEIFEYTFVDEELYEIQCTLVEYDEIEEHEMIAVGYALTPKLPSTEDSPKKSGGGCADCVPPTLGLDKNFKRIVDYGFSYNGNAVQVEKWHTSYPLINATVGEMNLVEIKVYENNGIHNMKWVQFGLGGKGIGMPLNNFEVIIQVDLVANSTGVGVDKIIITDKDDLIDNDTVTADVYPVECQDSSTTPNCLKVDLEYSYREETFNHIMVVNVADKPRNSQNFYLNEGVKVVGESLNPPPTYSMFNKKYSQQTENLYLTLTRTDKINYIWTDQFDVEYLQISDYRFDRLTPQEKYSCATDTIVIKSVTNRNNACQFMLLINYEIERAEHTMNDILSSYNYDIIIQWDHNNKALRQYEH